MISNLVSRTRSGVIVRYEESQDLLTYSPYNSLIFAVQSSHVKDVISWLNKQRLTAPSKEIEKALGPGWFIGHDAAEYNLPQLLPNSNESWKGLSNPKWPILINWFITGNCPLNCKYCYAEDLMRGRCKEPDEGEIVKIANTILSYSPLCVVITGGDPLLSSHLPIALKSLHGKTGIMLDTSAYTLSSAHLALFKKYNVAVRISFDSERPKVNQYQRPLAAGIKSSVTTLEAAVNALCICLQSNIPVSVQSVATKKTANDLLALGDKLYRLGVRSWRIHRVTPSSQKMKGYKELIGTERQQKQLYRHIFENLIRSYESTWRKKMALQVTHNEAPNAVILVSPDGVFYTESILKPEKIPLDTKYPKHPRQTMFFKKINITAHAERYLNLTSTRMNK